MAQIIKRGKQVYLIRVFLGRDEGGHQRYHNETFHGSLNLAGDRARRLETERDLGSLVQSASISLSAYLKSWLADAVKGKVSDRTHHDYSYIAERYIEPSLGLVPLRDLTPLHIQGLYSELQASGFSSRTIRYAHAVLSAALSQAVNWGYLSRNPAKLVRPPKLVRKIDIRPLSSDQAAAFLSAAKGTHFEALWMLAVDTGMRPEEYLGLRWPAVDLKSGMIRVEKVLVWKSEGGGWSLKEPKTDRSRRQIPISPATVAALTIHRKAQNEWRIKRGKKYQQHGFVFTSPRGTPVSASNLTSREFKPLLEKAKLVKKEHRLYDLRHTTATLLLAANVHPKIVSERLGHASIAITLDTYSHVLPSMQEAATEELHRILFPSGPAAATQ